MIPIQKALISVFDKAGLEPLVQALHQRKVEIYSTGGTASFIEKLGIPVTLVEKVTQFPEMMDGRVKTLHPKVFGGILARREVNDDVAHAKSHGIPLFDLIVVNLYPFGGHLKDDRSTQVKYVDIGGPSMIRAASKNFSAVCVLSDPKDYLSFLDHYAKENGKTTEAFRFQMAVATFERTAAYDQLIATTWNGNAIPSGLSLSPKTTLRYGENPHQSGAWVGEPKWKVYQGKELSYNNLLDAEAAYRLAFDFQSPAVAIIKHNTPCGVATAEAGKPVKIASLFQTAFECDSRSAFGGIVAVNRQVDGEAAIAMKDIFLEVVMAPSFSEEALEILKAKKNLRVIEWSEPQFNSFEVRSAMGGWLVQESDTRALPSQLKTVTENQSIEGVKESLHFAWIVSKHVKSNAIVIAKDGATLGIGGGQVSRVEALEIALQKSNAEKLKGAVLASDAFFPFRDNIDRLRGTGIAAIIQPGGSQRDEEVIAACNSLGIAMVFTGERHFRH